MPRRNMEAIEDAPRERMTDLPFEPRLTPLALLKKDKNMSQKPLAVVVAAAFAAATLSVHAQAPTSGEPAGPVKASPEQVKAIETWTYTLATQAATYCRAAGRDVQPALDGRLRRPSPRPSPNAIWRLEDISTPKLAG